MQTAAQRACAAVDDNRDDPRRSGLWGPLRLGFGYGVSIEAPA